MSLIGKKLLSLQNRADRQKAPKRQHKPFEQASTVGILFTWEDKGKEAVIAEFVQRLPDNLKLRYLCFNPDRKTEIDSSHPSFSENDLTLLGKIESEEADSFLQEPFDYLFHLDFELSEMMKSLLIRSRAHCRVGFHSEGGESFYELMIGINKNAGLHNFAEQILKYVNALS